jgi:superfamily II DNA or RNA helicase
VKRPVAVIDGMFRVSTRLLEGRVKLSELHKQLTAIHFDPETAVSTPVRMYRETKDSIILPRHFARKYFPDLWRRAIDRTVKPVRHMSMPIRIKPRDSGQQEFLNQLVALVNDNVIIDGLAVATTGSGKTASACMLQAELQIPTMLVIVHTNRLKEGWLGNDKEKKGLRFFYGDQWVADNVGVVQQRLSDYKGKRIVIAMGPSLVSRQYDPEFYSLFSLVIIDEAHKFAAPMLNKVLGMFPACARIGLTATPKTGEMGKITDAHSGKPVIISSQEVMRPKVYVIKFAEQVNYRDLNGDPLESRNALISALARNPRRQDMLANIIYWRGYMRGKQCLGLSDRTDQLINLKKRLIELGANPDDIGIYVGKHKTGKKKLTGKLIAGDSMLHLRALPGFATKAKAEEYVTSRIAELAQQAGVRRDNVIVQYKIQNEMIAPTKAEYEHMERSVPILLATYGVFDTGIDVKRLDYGMELSPRGDVKQATGRTLRIDRGKATPEWYTVTDHLTVLEEREILGETMRNLYKIKTPIRLAESRLSSYSKHNATIEYVDKPYEAIKAAKAYHASLNSD